MYLDRIQIDRKQEDSEKGHLDDDWAQRGQPVGRDEAEAVLKGTELEDAGDGEDIFLRAWLYSQHTNM